MATSPAAGAFSPLHDSPGLSFIEPGEGTTLAEKSGARLRVYGTAARGQAAKHSAPWPERFHTL